MSPVVGQVVLIIYALLLAGGGVMGYVKAGSRPSLIAGVGSAVVAIIALVLSLTLTGSRAGFLLGMVLALVLTLVFLRRLGKTHKFMPSGVLSLTSAIMVVVLVVVMTTG